MATSMIKGHYREWKRKWKSNGKSLGQAEHEEIYLTTMMRSGCVQPSCSHMNPITDIDLKFWH